MSNSIKLGPTGDVQELSAFGRKYSRGYVDGLTRRDRAASGKAREDVIAYKTIHSISYESADEAVLTRLNYLYRLGVELTLQVTHISTTETFTVLMAPFKQDRLLAINGGMWEGVNVELQEV
jgi:hypothetical protein